jgi:hypothetical protein
MLFGKKGEGSEVEMTVAILKEKFPEIYAEIDSKSIHLGEKVNELTNKVNELTLINSKLVSEKENREKIIAYANKLKIKEEDYKPLLTLTFNEAIIKMVDLTTVNLENMERLFKESGSIPLGNTGIAENVPKDFNEAMILISKRDKTTVQDAAIKAQTEFPKLFNILYDYKKGE